MLCSDFFYSKRLRVREIDVFVKLPFYTIVNFNTYSYSYKYDLGRYFSADSCFVVSRFLCHMCEVKNIYNFV